MRRRPKGAVAGLGLVLIGVGVLGCLGWQLYGTNVVAHHAQAKTLRRLDRQLSAPTPTTKATPVSVPKPRTGVAFGILTIPRMNLTVPIVQGVSLHQLAAGVGHYPDSPMPGQKGNVALAGHRTTHGAPFSRIADLEVGDLITIRLRGETTTYRVTGHRIVSPDQIDVVSSKGLEGRRILTLTSCHPKFSARQRYVVRAEQIS